VNPLVYVVDDDEAIRQALCALFDSVAIEARAYASASDFLDAASPGMKGCLVLDVRMPGMSGLDLQRVLNERGVPIPIIVISGHGDVAVAVRAMKAGAVDFLLKPFNEQDLLDSVLAALSLSDQASRRTRARQEAAAKFAKLTPREREILTLIMECKPNKLIAFDLNISEKTVDVHRFNIMHKTGARNLPELIQLRLLAGEEMS
jgi:two-component system response regulator FixJ